MGQNFQQSKIPNCEFNFLQFSYKANLFKIFCFTISGKVKLKIRTQ